MFNRIYIAKHVYESKHLEHPNTVYLGHSEYKALRMEMTQENIYFTACVDPDERPRPTVRGMEIFVVDAESHLHVCRIDK